MMLVRLLRHFGVDFGQVISRPTPALGSTTYHGFPMAVPRRAAIYSGHADRAPDTLAYYIFNSRSLTSKEEVGLLAGYGLMPFLTQSNKIFAHSAGRRRKTMRRARALPRFQRGPRRQFSPMARKVQETFH